MQECTALINLSPYLKARHNLMLYMWPENVRVKLNLSTRYKCVLSFTFRLPTAFCKLNVLLNLAVRFCNV